MKMPRFSILLRRAASVLLLVVGGGYLLRSLYGQLDDALAAASAISTSEYFLLALLACAGLIPAILYHSIAIKRLIPLAPHWSVISSAFASSQIARYMPGKVFSIVAEYTLLQGRVPATIIVQATLSQTAISYAWALALSFLILWSSVVARWEPLILVIPTAYLVWLAHRRCLIERMVAFASRVLHRPSSDSQPVARYNMAATALIVLQWLPFFGLWRIVAGDWNSGAVLASCYLLASIAGSLVVVVPSGMVIREAAFTAMGVKYGFSAVELVPWAVLVRALLTLGDVFIALVLWLWTRGRDEPATAEAPTDSSLRQGWNDRQRTLGNTPSAVLLKGLPDSINGLIHGWHAAVLTWSIRSRGLGSATGCTLDVGCGYGRMAPTARAAGIDDLIGLDFAQGFCRQFALVHGNAICANLASVPLRTGSLSAAYAITSLMYLSDEKAAQTLRRIDDALALDGQVLLIEPSSEFNAVARRLMPWKRREVLARPGFTYKQMTENIVPSGWKIDASGSNFWATALLPVLMVLARSPRWLGHIERLIARMDAPAPQRAGRGLGRLALHRWVLYRKSGGVSPGSRHNNQT